MLPLELHALGATLSLQGLRPIEFRAMHRTVRPSDVIEKAIQQTVLLRLIIEVYDAVDIGYVTLLRTPGREGAFNMVDHGILLNRLSISYRAVGHSLEWLRSFLDGRTNRLPSARTT